MLLSVRITATRSNLANLIFRYGPAVAALVYPLAVAFLHLAARQFLLATDATGSLPAGLAVCLAVALVGSAPILSFTVISLSDRSRERSVAHLAFAAPPLFTLTGVAFFFLGIPNGDYVVWVIAWLAALAFAAQPAPAKTGPAASARWIRSVHGMAAATIVLMFLLWHLANHIVAILGGRYEQGDDGIATVVVPLRPRAASPGYIVRMPIDDWIPPAVREGCTWGRYLLIHSDSHCSLFTCVHPLSSHRGLHFGTMVLGC